LGILEMGKIVVDVVGLALDLGVYGKLGYQVKSRSQPGRPRRKIKGGLDVCRVMGKNIAETPGRMAAAVERGDYGTFGSEAMNLAMIARAGVQAPRAMLGAAELVGNPLVRSLGALGAPGRALRTSIRNAQLRWMQPKAARVSGGR
jgi:hypothetical protein